MLWGLPCSNELVRWSGHSWSLSTASSSACTSCVGSFCGTSLTIFGSAATDSSYDPVMLHRCKWLYKWCIRWDGMCWSLLYAMEMNTFSFIGQDRWIILLLGSQHHQKTCTISTYHILHSLLLLTTTMHPNYRKATHRCYSC
jgi:hypothetical protein